MTNFYVEIVNDLAECGYGLEDIDFVCNRYNGDWIESRVFLDSIGDYIYDEGYGTPQVPLGLSIVMKDGNWFERGEYDGSEWWEFKQLPRKKEHVTLIKDISRLDYYDREGWINWVGDRNGTEVS